MQQAVCVRRRKKNGGKKYTHKMNPAAPKSTPRNPQQPGDRDHLETACDETRPRVSPYSHASSIDPGFVEVDLTCIHASILALLLCRLYTFWCPIFWRAQLLSLLRYLVYMYLRFRGCPVVLDIEPSVSALYHKTRRVLLRATSFLLLLLTAESKKRRRAV